MQKLTREWLRKADSDLRAAGLLAKHRPRPNDQIIQALLLTSSPFSLYVD
jgi:hypothetical protein